MFDARQARRLFAFIRLGRASAGLAGPAAGALLVGTLGRRLVLLAGLLLGVALALKRPLMRWRERGGAGRPGACRPRARAGGRRQPVQRTHPRAALAIPARGVGLRVLLAGVTTFLYFEQARLVATLVPIETSSAGVQRDRIVVQAGALLPQAFLTGRVAQQLGVRVLLAGVPLLVCVGFVGLALAPGFAMLAALMVVRRVGEHAFVRPGREMLFAPLDAERKYKAKAFIDTVVYRGGTRQRMGQERWLIGRACVGGNDRRGLRPAGARWVVLGGRADAREGASDRRNLHRRRGRHRRAGAAR